MPPHTRATDELRFMPFDRPSMPSDIDDARSMPQFDDTERRRARIYAVCDERARHLRATRRRCLLMFPYSRPCFADTAPDECDAAAIADAEYQPSTATAYMSATIAALARDKN